MNKSRILIGLAISIIACKKKDSQIIEETNTNSTNNTDFRDKFIGAYIIEEKNVETYYDKYDQSRNTILDTFNFTITKSSFEEIIKDKSRIYIDSLSDVNLPITMNFDSSFMVVIIKENGEVMSFDGGDSGYRGSISNDTLNYYSGYSGCGYSYITTFIGIKQ